MGRTEKAPTATSLPSPSSITSARCGLLLLPFLLVVLDLSAIPSAARAQPVRPAAPPRPVQCASPARSAQPQQAAYAPVFRHPSAGAAFGHPRHHVVHPNCQLRSLRNIGLCCWCADRRPLVAAGYVEYGDGRKQLTVTRHARYCPTCTQASA